MEKVRQRGAATAGGLKKSTSEYDVLRSEHFHEEHDDENRKKQLHQKQIRQSSVGFYKIIFGSLLGWVCLSMVVFGNFTFDYELPSLIWLKKKLFPKPDKIFTIQELAKYDGTNGKPMYISINGNVFDVSAGKSHYGKGKGYNVFVGRDASRAFITGCFKTHLTHDLRGFTTDQISSLKEWVEFYMNHPKYEYVGRVNLPPIDPKSPVPADCNPEKSGPTDEKIKAKGSDRKPVK